MSNPLSSIRVEVLGSKVLLGVHSRDRLDGVILTLTEAQALELSGLLAHAAARVKQPSGTEGVGWVESA